MSLPDSKSRFTDRVAMYVAYRPTYPPAVLDYLRHLGFLQPGMTIADIGSGTGISAVPFVQAGWSVVGVEPNAAMRAAAEQMLADETRFISVAGSAEATTLPAASVDLVIAGQAFHWFDRQAARQEFRRILRPGGAVALFWNTRELTSSPFAEQYEALLQEYCTDYGRVRHDAISASDIAVFFAPAEVHAATFPSSQRFDYTGLEGRLLSSSYAPPAGHPAHAPMLAALRAIFDACQVQGFVTMAYRTEVYAGRL